MLSKIHKVKKLGLVFSDFSWSAGTPAFKAVNLIYGWNGCGKTTFIRLFDDLAAPGIDSLEYDLENEGGTRFAQGTSYPVPIRVFNQDYVQKNVRILESSANTISILLGKENKDRVAQIEADEQTLNGDPADPTKIGKLQELHGYSEKRERKVRGNDTAFTDIARTIGAATAGSAVASRNYRAPDARRDFGTLTAPAILSDADLDRENLALRQEPLARLQLLALPNLAVEGNESSFIEVLANCSEEAVKLCEATAESEVVSRLKEHPDIATWVEEGVRLHAAHDSAVCEYCGNSISLERLAQLARHFSEADQSIKRRIDGTLVALRQAYAALEHFDFYDSARLYQELRPPFEASAADLSSARIALRDHITTVGKTLAAKKLDTSKPILPGPPLNEAALVAAIATANAILNVHNAKSAEFEQVRATALNRVKLHYLSTIYDDVTRRAREIAELEPDLKRREEEIGEIRSRIALARAQISSAHRACEKISGALATFLGRNELRFEPDEQELDGVKAIVGYRIMRGTERANYLSEGEKTAVAFVYFIIHLDDGQFPKANGMVVIDDPISSLDSNSLYQAYSFLKNAVVECKQVFILTHNFDFLKLLLNWRSIQKLKNQTSYYMIRNYMEGAERRAMVTEMDKELKDYSSEYQYLFKRLREMQAEQDGTIMRAYPVPNIARKVWESFLTYRVPNSKSPYTKMDELKEAGFDAQKLDAIYKFTNAQSHITGGGFDPALVPETHKVLDEIFEMMKLIAPEHYEILDKAVA